MTSQKNAFDVIEERWWRHRRTLIRHEERRWCHRMRAVSNLTRLWLPCRRCGTCAWPDPWCCAPSSCASTSSTSGQSSRRTGRTETASTSRGHLKNFLRKSLIVCPLFFCQQTSLATTIPPISFLNFGKTKWNIFLEQIHKMSRCHCLCNKFFSYFSHIFLF